MPKKGSKQGGKKIHEAPSKLSTTPATPPANPAKATAETPGTPRSLFAAPEPSVAPNNENQPFVIGVAGGTASGKTTVCRKIMHRLQGQRVAFISQDSFYKNLTPEENVQATESNYNFDHPDAFDMDTLIEALALLRRRQPARIPEYSFVTNSRSETEFTICNPADVIVVEGILVLNDPGLRDMMNMKVYVETDDDVRLARRIQRDIEERGRDVSGVIEQYTRFVKPMFEQFVRPSGRFADVIIPWGRGDNVVAIDVIAEHIRSKIGTHDLRRVYPNLHVVPVTNQIRGMHTCIRNVNTHTSDFVFYADRLNRCVVEAGLGHLPFRQTVVNTPTGSQYDGVSFCPDICGVSVIRSGEAMENALRACCKGIKIGKILVSRGEGTVVYERLPADIANRYVLLMDPMLGTGRTAVQSIQVLVSKGVPEDHILFLTLISAPAGIHNVFKHFPTVKLITSEIDGDEGLSLLHPPGSPQSIVPGLGDFGDRYFGTI